jgi:hypothetical protein
MKKFFLIGHPFPLEFSSAVAKSMAGQAGSLDPHQPSLKLWRGKQTFSRTTCPAKNMLPAYAGTKKTLCAMR